MDFSSYLFRIFQAAMKEAEKLNMAPSDAEAYAFAKVDAELETTLA